MKRIFITTIAACLLLIVGCQNERLVDLSEKSTSEAIQSDAHGRAEVITPMGMAYPGQIIVKLAENTVDDLKIERFGNVQLQSVPSPMSAALTSIKATQVSRLFPPAGKYEPRSRKAGMHLWYVIDFDKDVNVLSAINTMASVKGVESVEYLPVIELYSVDRPDNFLSNSASYFFQRGSEMPFNDPRLPEQWHYNNTGKVNGAVTGADINLFEAWKINTGSNKVIVSVVDGGINVKHEDLKDNLWVNTAELNGEPGVDDDNNGFVDDIHGYCFVANTGDLLPDEDAHGTHVAGTIAARNNNGIGVAGIAGGDGSLGSGVRLQSAAIFRNGYKNGGDGARAIKYGADNGAVISQNSWGYPYKSGIVTIPPSLKAAIDYFTDYAGTDENGNQRNDSPMKGGLVIIAAGNDNVEFNSQPASYERAVAVASFGPNFNKASYSTYGSWVDISAPGGDQNRYGTRSGVLSTLAKDIVSADYGYYQGTSMACPHVSGVAALIVSQFGGPGFTNEDLRERLLAAVLPIDIDEENPGYAGKLGRGYIDAYAALTIENKNIAPDAPTFDVEKTAKSDYTSITAYWNVPADGDDGTPSRYQLYYSTEELNATNYKSKGILVGPISGYINGLGLSVGDEMSYYIGNLSPDTKYYFAVIAYDRWGHSSKPSFHSAMTKKNNPPEITNVPSEPIMLMDILGSTSYDLEVKEIDGHSWTYTISGDIQGISHTKNNGIIKITIRPVLSEGDYTLKVKLTDELKATSEYEIPFRIITVKTPVKRGDIPAQLIGVNNDAMNINLTDYFEPQEYLTLEYKATASNGTLISTTVDENGILSLKGFKPGKTMVTVDVTNGHKSTRTSFEVTVVEDVNKDVYAIWPLPIQNDLNIWVNPKHKTAKLQLISVSGEVVLEKTITPDMSGVAKVDMKKVAPGSYTLMVEAGQTPFTKAVLKR